MLCRGISCGRILTLGSIAVICRGVPIVDLIVGSLVPTYACMHGAIEGPVLDSIDGRDRDGI